MSQLSSRHAQKLETIGRIAAGVSHDFNNLLGSIRLNLDLALNTEDPTNRTRLLGRALKTVERGSQITNSMQVFSKQSEPNLEVVSVDDFVKNLEHLLKGALGGAVHFSTSLESGKNVLVDPALLQSALLNLALNAKDAVGTVEFAEVEISTSTVDAGDLPMSRQDGRYDECSAVEIMVRDNGCGIPKDLKETLFEPFVSGGKFGGHSGLGLSMVKSFAEQSNGRAWAENNSGGGACIHILLPASSQNAFEHTIAPPRVWKSDAVDTILLVEDQSDFMESLTEMLSRMGYHLLTAANADEAISLLSQTSHIDLVISDVVLPGSRTGFDVAEFASNCSRSIPSILMSGFVPDTAETDVFQTRNHKVLKKPFGREQLAERIFELEPAAPVKLEEVEGLAQ